MKTQIFLNKSSIVRFTVVTIIVSLFFTACYDSDKIENINTFTDRTMGEYLMDSTKVYSEFNKLLDTTNVMGLLKATGLYTCFAPTNDAMYAFYKEKGKKTLADFQMDSLRVMAYDHIINGSEVLFSDFRTGRLSPLSMSDRYFSISFNSVGQALVNKTPTKAGSLILEKDIVVHNGVIHKIDKVLDPTRAGIVEAISMDSTFGIFYNALVRTGLADSLLKDKDKTYDPNLWTQLITNPRSAGNWDYEQIPMSRKYGYTVLMESDLTLSKNGITDFASLKQYAASIYDKVYPGSASISDVTDRNNSLNRFVAYHLINKQLSYTQFIDDYVMNKNDFTLSHMINSPGLNMYEYIEPMCPNTLIEVTRKGGTQETNLINRNPETDISIHIVKANSDKDAVNGVYHEIDGMLVYSSDVDNILSTKRLRFDAASFFPELTNNNMRGYVNCSDDATKDLKYRLPRGYIDRLSTSEQTVVSYLTPYYKYQDYEGDEIFLGAAKGKLYDFSIVTPPVPAGTYEVRFGFLVTSNRGVAQLYLDNVPAGVPLNLRTNAQDASIGWVAPNSDAADYDGFENDKMMHNRGYMKGPACFRVVNTAWTSGKNSRYCSSAVRKIMGTYTFKTASNHLLTVKGLSGGEFMMDYIEFVPTSALETEDIY